MRWLLNSATLVLLAQVAPDATAIVLLRAGCLVGDVLGVEIDD